MNSYREILKFTLLTIATILGLSGNSLGQENTVSNPYIDSEHSYRIKIDKEDNDRQWQIVDLTTNTIYDLDDGSNSEWVTYTPAEDDGGWDIVQIDFRRDDPFTIGDWRLEYREEDNNHNCVSARSFPITISDNTFFLTVSGSGAVCNSETGLIHTYTQVSTNTPSTYTSVEYTIVMTKDDDFDPTSWSFEVDFAPDVYTVSQATSDGSTITRSASTSGNDYKFVVVPTAANPSGVTVTITAQFLNDVLDDQTATMEISDGFAIVSLSGAPDAITDDNITATGNDEDRTHAILIQGLPDTRDIGPDGESLASATNPLQYSTHNYTIEMGDPANYSRVSWHLEYNDGSVVPDLPENYISVIPASADGDFADARFTFNMTPNVTGEQYRIVYTEEGANGCSTVRVFPFTLGQPFDADITGPGTICSGASGNIYDNLQSVETTVDYTVAFATGFSYSEDWHFTFGLSSVPGFVDGNLSVNSISVISAGAGYTSIDDVSGTVNVTNTGTVTSVTIRVVYEGLYTDLHTITASLTNIAGSHEEVDRDVNNRTELIIYRMPQTGELAGVD